MFFSLCKTFFDLPDLYRMIRFVAIETAPYSFDDVLTRENALTLYLHRFHGLDIHVIKTDDGMPKLDGDYEWLKDLSLDETINPNTAAGFAIKLRYLTASEWQQFDQELFAMRNWMADAGLLYRDGIGSEAHSYRASLALLEKPELTIAR